MPVYDVTLKGFDAESDATDHLVKWVKAPSAEAVQRFVGDLPLHEAPRLLRPGQDTSRMDFLDGVDVVLDMAGNVVAASPAYRGGDVLREWRRQVRSG